MKLKKIVTCNHFLNNWYFNNSNTWIPPFDHFTFQYLCRCFQAYIKYWYTLTTFKHFKRFVLAWREPFATEHRQPRGVYGSNYRYGEVVCLHYMFKRSRKMAR